MNNLRISTKLTIAFAALMFVLAAFLVRERIDSISLNPDSFVQTVRHIARQEQLSAPHAVRPRRPAPVE